MSHFRFEWDPDKAASNVRKHAVSFDEAATAFSDEGALVIDDPDHSDEENRFILLGLSAKLRLLVVIHCYREQDEVIRIVSARKASRTESRQYTTR
jgi:uncharacterized DUF497 family protein